MSTIAYKLTDQDGYTRRDVYGQTLWTVGSVVAPTGNARYQLGEPQPCGSGVLHAYIAPEVAVLLDELHAYFGPTARLFRIETVESNGKWYNDGQKRWTDSSVRVLEELPLPILAIEERIAWAICIAPCTHTRKWAIDWLSGADRTAASALRATEIAGYHLKYGAENAAWAAHYACGLMPKIDVAARCAARSAAHSGAHLFSAPNESVLIPALIKARAILAGEMPAEEYDANNL